MSSRDECAVDDGVDGLDRVDAFDLFSVDEERGCGTHAKGIGLGIEHGGVYLGRILLEDAGGQHRLVVCTDSRAVRARENYEGKGINLYVLGAIEEVGAVYDNVDDIIPVLQQWKAELEG